MSLPDVISGPFRCGSNAAAIALKWGDVMNMHAANCAEDVSAIQFQTAGSYTINGRHEFPCSTVGTTPTGLELRVMVKPRIGDRVDAIFDTIGHLQGYVRQLTPAGAVVALDPGLHAALNEQFAFLAESTARDARRRHFRIKPRRPETTIRVANRLPCPAYVVDCSISGACIETDAPLQLGEAIAFARSTRAKIVRVLGDRRFGVEFFQQLRPQDFSWNIRL